MKFIVLTVAIWTAIFSRGLRRRSHPGTWDHPCSESGRIRLPDAVVRRVHLAPCSVVGCMCPIIDDGPVKLCFVHGSAVYRSELIEISDKCADLACSDADLGALVAWAVGLASLRSAAAAGN